MNNFGEIAKIIFDTAPKLASWLVSPSANVAMQVISEAVGITGKTPEAAKTPVIEALKTNPDLFPKLRAIEEKYAPVILPLIEQTPSKLAITIQVEWMQPNEQTASKPKS